MKSPLRYAFYSDYNNCPETSRTAVTELDRTKLGDGEMFIAFFVRTTDRPTDRSVGSDCSLPFL
jgi:hypothetical protein